MLERRHRPGGKLPRQSRDEPRPEGPDRLSARRPAGFTGQTVLLARQRELSRRWTISPDTHPHEALLGILALVHGTSSLEVRGLRTDDIDHGARAVRLGKRPRPVPLDPASWDALQRCLAHRDARATENPHVMVTRGTRARTCPASAAYVSHVLDPCGAAPDAPQHPADRPGQHHGPQLVAAAFGMDAQSVMIYLADRIDPGRMPARGLSTGRLSGHPS